MNNRQMRQRPEAVFMNKCEKIKKEKENDKLGPTGTVNTMIGNTNNTNKAHPFFHTKLDHGAEYPYDPVDNQVELIDAVAG